jgi:3-hydroxybutyryl-CoA dehydrogenase
MAELNKIGIVGAGAMGRNIALFFAQTDHQVQLFDVNQDAVTSALDAVRNSLGRAVEKQRVSAAEADATIGRLHAANDLGELADCDVVIEAIVEKLEIKQSLFAQLESICGPETVLATNTSSLSVADIFAKLDRKDRALGLHFFNPAHIMKLVEVITAPPVSQIRCDDLVIHLNQIGKTAIKVKDSPGFIVNRCARPFYGEALAILEEGMFSAHQVDAAVRQAGFRMGPFELIDLVGADINLAASETMAKAFNHHPRYYVFDRLKQQVAQGRLGRKSGTGFVTDEADAELSEADQQRIAQRILATLINEAASALDDQVAAPQDIDLAMQLGLNFPKGPFAFLAEIGLDRVREILRQLDATAPANLKGRYQPATALQRGSIDA